MEPADSIGRLGFARWYERRLIEAHAWLITGLISMVAIPACMEELTFRGSIARLLAYTLFMCGAAAVGIYALMRYQKMLAEAERLGEQATCAACGTYARFMLVTGSKVRCRKCKNEWFLVGPG